MQALAAGLDPKVEMNPILIKPNSDTGSQIVVSCAVLVAMGFNPLDPASLRADDAARAIWWAGPAIGLLNLVQRIRRHPFRAHVHPT